MWVAWLVRSLSGVKDEIRHCRMNGDLLQCLYHCTALQEVYYSFRWTVTSCSASSLCSPTHSFKKRYDKAQGAGREWTSQQPAKRRGQEQNSTPVTTKQASTVTSLTQSLTQLHLYTLMYIPVNWMKHLHRLNITTKFLYITVCPTSTGLRSIVSASQNSYETKLQVTSFSPPFCYQKLQSS